MTSWTVWYESWQMECCGTPFSVGDEVSLPLMITPADRLDAAEEWPLSVVEGPVRAVEDDEGDRWDVVRAEGGLDVAPHASLGTPSGRLSVTGLLSVERHTGQWPEAVGRVASVRILTRGYAPETPGGTTYVPVPGERWLRPVDACPKWFTGDDPARRDDGALVVLDAMGGPGGPSARGRGQ
ncbi:DUF6578 domain-containing protein [Streptomyces sp. NPDC059639]|uniref:DUF6578 domain-containing protein n=1 Tax=Streptomyces sp. NPDC059639 TaxID=3346891 RepID=UPI003698B533